MLQVILTCILQEEPHWYVGRMKDELASGPIDSPFTDSGFRLQTQGLGPNPEDVHAFTLKHFRSSTGSQREIFTSESRSGEASRVSLSCEEVEVQRGFQICQKPHSYPEAEFKSPGSRVYT